MLLKLCIADTAMMGMGVGMGKGEGGRGDWIQYVKGPHIINTARKTEHLPWRVGSFGPP
jgi:hypothetical protein